MQGEPADHSLKLPDESEEEAQMANQQDRSWPMARAAAYLVLALMAAATLYGGWIALTNFHRIGV
jgi:hypothetical protein